MPVIVSKSEKLCVLEQEILNGKNVILLESDDVSFLNLICAGIEEKFLSEVEVWHHIDNTSESKHVKYISQKEMDEILEIYHMYDFSDKITVLSDPTQYGSLFNYVKTGILTKQEMVDALLYKI